VLYFRVITKANEELIHIYYSALNFRNVMTASGKLTLQVFDSDRLNQVRTKTFVYSLSLGNSMYEQYWSFPALPLILELIILLV
jgi:hypothetical protein